MGVRSGYDSSKPVRRIVLQDGAYHVSAKLLERLEIYFGGMVLYPPAIRSSARIGSNWPAGLKLDAQAGIFYWEPGAGFAGSFELIFKPSASATGEAGGQSVPLDRHAALRVVDKHRQRRRPAEGVQPSPVADGPHGCEAGPLRRRAGASGRIRATDRRGRDHRSSGSRGAPPGRHDRKSSPTTAAMVAANCEVVTVTDARTPSGATPGPSAGIHVDSAAGTFLP